MSASLFSKTTEELICDIYASDKSLSAIAKVYKCSLVTIRNVLRRHNKTLRGRGNRFRVDEKIAMAICADYKSGASQSFLARKYSFSQSRVSRILRHNGITPRIIRLRREQHPNWKGGRITAGNHYCAVLIDHTDPLFCMAAETGYVMEHRLVMARYLGRPLFKWETVHHKDNDKRNNDLTNLQLRIGQHGDGIILKCSRCGCINLIPDEI